jgi:hypothetical protein
MVIFTLDGASVILARKREYWQCWTQVSISLDTETPLKSCVYNFQKVIRVCMERFEEMVKVAEKHAVSFTLQNEARRL